MCSFNLGFKSYSWKVASGGGQRKKAKSLAVVLIDDNIVFAFNYFYVNLNIWIGICPLLRLL